MEPADKALVQKYLSATLSKVAKMKNNLAAAKDTLARQEQALYAAAEEMAAAQDQDIVAPVGLPPQKSPSILDGEVDMSQINAAIKKLTGGCDCPNLHPGNFLPSKEGT